MSSKLHKVLWSEGMYLAPHHFQAQARFFDETLLFLADCLFRYPYGLLSCELDHAALASGRFVLRQARGVMKDGLPFRMTEPKERPVERLFGDSFPVSSKSLTAYLAVPKYRDGEANVLLDDKAASSIRMRKATAELADVNTGQDLRQISLQKPNLRIAFEDEIADEDEALPIARVLRDGLGRYFADPDFIPPCLDLKASSALESLLNRAIEILIAKGQDLVSRRRGAQASDVRYDPQELTEFWLLHTVNASLPELIHFRDTKTAHPEQIFLSLSRLAGALCTFLVDSSPATLPAYNHVDLGACFVYLESHIRKHLEIVVDTNCVTIPLLRQEALFHRANVDDPRCFGSARWILGVKADVSESMLASHSAELVKVSSRDWIGRVVRQSLPGVPLIYLANAPNSVPAKPGYVYFSIDRAHRLFQPITDQRAIGVYTPEQLANPELELSVIFGGQ